MFKKILLILLLTFGIFVNHSFAIDDLLALTQKEKMEISESLAKDAQIKVNELDNQHKQKLETDPNCRRPSCYNLVDQINDAQKKVEETTTTYEADKKAYDEWPESAWDIRSPGYQISVNDISPWMKVEAGNTTSQNVNSVFGKIIKSMMILLWSLALLIMTIWGWYIILHHGQDELLSKWKSIFMSWVYALVVALSSYYLVDIFRNILYK